MILVLTLCLSCQPRKASYLRFPMDNKIAEQYNLDFYPEFTYSFNSCLFNLSEKGLIEKKKAKYYLKFKHQVDTLFVYSYSKFSSGAQGYSVDFSHLSVSRNNRLSMKLAQENLKYTVNGKPFVINKNGLRNIAYYKDSVIYIEVSDSLGVKVGDYLTLKFNKRLEFKKLEENETMENFFRVSPTGRSIYVHSRFVGTSKYYARKSRNEIHKYVNYPKMEKKFILRYKHFHTDEIESYILSLLDTFEYKSGAYSYHKRPVKSIKDSIWIFDQLVFFKKDTAKIVTISKMRDNIIVINTKLVSFGYETEDFFKPFEKIIYTHKVDSVRLASPPWGDDSISLAVLTKTSKRSVVFRMYSCYPNISKPHPICILMNL